jgi:hypothetical protein
VLKTISDEKEKQRTEKKKLSSPSSSLSSSADFNQEYQQPLLGLDFTTVHLATVFDDSHLSMIIKHAKRLKGLNSSQFNLLSLGCNYMTIDKVKQIISSLQQEDKDMNFIGTEVLRIHEKKPGQISTNYDYHLKHRYLNQKLYDMKIPRLAAAIMDYNHALDATIQVEEALVKKVCCLVIDWLPVCSLFFVFSLFLFLSLFCFVGSSGDT